MTRDNLRLAFQGASLTVLTLFGGLLLGTAIGFGVFESLPGHSTLSPSALHISLAALPAFIGFLGGSAVWGWWMGRMAGSTETRRMAVAGMLGFAPITLVLGIGLSAVEPFVIEQIGALFPVHRIFTLMFVPSAFLIASVSAWAVGRGLRSQPLAYSLLGRCGGHSFSHYQFGDGIFGLGGGRAKRGGTLHYAHCDVSRQPRRGAGGWCGVGRMYHAARPTNTYGSPLT